MLLLHSICRTTADTAVLKHQRGIAIHKTHDDHTHALPDPLVYAFTSFSLSKWNYKIMILHREFFSFTQLVSEGEGRVSGEDIEETPMT